jgi:hypothetical protein
MAEYYPIEFLPENPELANPTTRNFFRNNLPIEELNNNVINENIVATFGKKYDYKTSSINNNILKNKHETIVDKEKLNENNTNNNNNNNNDINSRVTRINIDSRLRNTQPKHILDKKINNLQNALYFTSNSNSITVYHPNHGYSIEDKFILEFATSKNIKIKNGLIFQKGSSFVRINQPNHGMIDGNTYTIQISNVTGNINSGTYLLNYPINLINKTHTVYFRRTSTDPFDPNNYYIQLDIEAEIEYTYQYSFNLAYLNIRNIPLNEINADYPISPDRINGYQIIDSIINENFYTFSVTSLSDSSTLSSPLTYNSPPVAGDGNNIMIIKIIDTISGYPDNNNYQINLQRNFYHVTQINLINAIFPITQKLVNPQNNLFYWQNLADGNTIYSVTVPSGNYSLSDLATQLSELINKTTRPNIDSSKLINSIYTYNTNYSVVNINQVQNTFSIQFYQNVILSNAIFKSKTVYSDGFTRILINYPNHTLIAGNSLTLSNVIGTENIPAQYLNGTFIIEEVIDVNTFTIKLDRFNADNSDSTNGGTAIRLLVPIQSRLLFNIPNTIGNVLGFNNVGDSNSITSYSYTINNYDLYEIDIQENSIGIATQPRIDTRVLNINPNNYVLMLTDLPFNDQINLFNTSTNAFAKLYLAGELNDYVYDQYIQLGSSFQEPLATLSTITFSFYGPDNKLYDFNNVEHSFTIEIIEQLDQLNIIGFETG